MGVVKQSVGKLRAVRPGQIRREAQRPFRLVLIAAEEAEREALVRVLIPEGMGSAERGHALNVLAAASGHPGLPEVVVCTPRAAAGASCSASVVIDVTAPETGLRALLRAHPGLRLALARTFPPLRDLLARELIRGAAARNAAVAALSALPEVIPTPLSLILALGEMGSDTVVITGNQIGLAFELAALRGEVAGWRAQAGPVLSIIASGLGWRTLARELVGLIPAGVGLTAKTAIAYSGTMAVGTALWKLPVRRARPPRRRVARTSPPVLPPFPRPFSRRASTQVGAASRGHEQSGPPLPQSKAALKRPAPGPQREAQGWQRERPSEKWRATQTCHRPAIGVVVNKGACQ